MQQTSRRSSSSMPTPTPVRSARCSSRRSSARSAASSDSTSSANADAAPVSNASTFTLASSTADSCDPAKEDRPETAPLQIPKSTSKSPAKPPSPVDLAAYYTFSKRNSKVVHDDSQGLSGFLEYRKLNGTWRPFLFQTIGHQLVLYRVHSSHQVLVMSTDIRSASEIALHYEGAKGQDDTRLLRLGINGTTITLRAVTHRAAVHWVEGLQRLRDGKSLQIVSDPPCSESEEDIFNEIDKLLYLREWTPPPPSTPLCGLCISTKKPEPRTAGMLLNAKMKSQDEATSTGCKIC